MIWVDKKELEKPLPNEYDETAIKLEVEQAARTRLKVMIRQQRIRRINISTLKSPINLKPQNLAT